MSVDEVRLLVSEEISRHGLQVASEGVVAISHYVELLGIWCSRHRIVGDASAGSVVSVHVSDSLAWLRAVQSVCEPAKGPVHAVDVGTGAGVPGLVAAVAWEQLDVLLCEKRLKRVSFLYWVLQQLPVEAAVFGRGVEELIATGRRFDHVVSRGFRAPGQWLSVAERLVGPSGWIWFLLTHDQCLPGVSPDREYRYQLRDGRERRVVGLRGRSSM